MIEFMRDADLRLQVGAALDGLPKRRICSIQRDDRLRRPDNQVAERFRLAAFSLIQTGAWSLVFSHPLT